MEQHSSFRFSGASMVAVFELPAGAKTFRVSTGVEPPLDYRSVPGDGPNALQGIVV
jgi:hypothetical protein